MNTKNNHKKGEKKAITVEQKRERQKITKKKER